MSEEPDIRRHVAMAYTGELRTKTVVEFGCIANDNPNVVVKEVNDALADGWQLHGSVYPNGNGGCVQFIVKYEQQPVI